MTEPGEHEIKGLTLQGRVIDKALDEGTWLQRHFIALEKEPGGQFLALHDATDAGRDFIDMVGKWVEVEGDLWFQSFSVQTIVGLDEPTP